MFARGVVDDAAGLGRAQFITDKVTIGDETLVYKMTVMMGARAACFSFLFKLFTHRYIVVLMWTVAALPRCRDDVDVIATRVVSPDDFDDFDDDDDDDGDDDDDEWCQGGGQDDDDAHARARARWRARWTRRIASEGKPRRARGG